MTPPPFLVEYRPMIRTVKDKITEIADKIQQSDDYELRVGYVVYR
jgi:ribosomal protein S3AE